MIKRILRLLRFYIRLIKVPQTGLLFFTAIAGYLGAKGNHDSITLLIAGIGLLFVISGTTAFNMVFDRDIDYIMERTKRRPVPTGRISARAAFVFGLFLIISGLLLSFSVSLIFAIIVALGMFFDFVIYTLWLKRRSSLSILFGGLAGGMPILSGRVLAIGKIDIIGLLLALAILLWIPTHILTLAMKYSRDYKLAGVPTFPNVFGFVYTRYVIAVSNLISAGIVTYVLFLVEVTLTGILICFAGGFLLLLFSLKIIKDPGDKAYFSLFKYASVYMVVVMLIIILK